MEYKAMQASEIIITSKLLLKHISSQVEIIEFAFYLKVRGSSMSRELPQLTVRTLCLLLEESISLFNLEAKKSMELGLFVVNTYL